MNFTCWFVGAMDDGVRLHKTRILRRHQIKSLHESLPLKRWMNCYVNSNIQAIFEITNTAELDPIST